MFGGFGITELLIVLVIVMLLFGTNKLKSLGSDLGSAIKGFRSAMDDNNSGSKQPPSLENKSEPEPTLTPEQNLNREKDQTEGEGRN